MRDFPVNGLDKSRDFTLTRGVCQCRLTYLGSCEHHTTRFEACKLHNGRDQMEERDKIIAKLRLLYRQAEQWAREDIP